MLELLILLDTITAGLAFYAYHKKGFWFYGMLSYVALCMVSVYAASIITGNAHLYYDNVSIRWFAVDVGLFGYMINDLASKKLPCVK